MKKKRLYFGLLNLLFLFIGAQVYGQQADQDTVGSSQEFQAPSLGKKDYDARGEEIKYPRSYGGLTFTRIDWGFSRLIDKGGFSLRNQNQFLSYKKASNFGFDIAQFGLRFNDASKVYISAGFEWNYLRLKKDVILDSETTPLSYHLSDIPYQKNILTTTYLRLPLSYEWRGKRQYLNARPKIAAGIMTGFLLKGTQRLKSQEEGKQKFKDDYHFAKFQYGAFARVGLGSFGLFAKYYLNDFIQDSPQQENLHNFTFGLTLGF